MYRFQLFLLAVGAGTMLGLIGPGMVFSFALIAGAVNSETILFLLGCPFLLALSFALIGGLSASMSKNTSLSYWVLCGFDLIILIGLFYFVDNVGFTSRENYGVMWILNILNANSLLSGSYAIKVVHALSKPRTRLLDKSPRISQDLFDEARAHFGRNSKTESVRVQPQEMKERDTL